MKLSVAFVSLGAVVGLMSSVIQGCSTTSHQVVIGGVTNVVQTTTLDPQRTADLIRAVLPAGVSIAVDRDTNSIPYFEAAEVILSTALASGNYDAVALKTALDGISIKELRTPEAEGIIQAAFGIYNAYAGKVVSSKLDQSIWVKPVLQAIADGIKQGL